MMRVVSKPEKYGFLTSQLSSWRSSLQHGISMTWAPGNKSSFRASLSPLVCYLQETLLAENIGQHYDELGATAPIVLIPMSYHTSTVIAMMSDVAISIIICLNYLYTVYTSNSKKACKTPGQPLLTITARITTANMSYHTTDWESVSPQLLAGWWYRTWSDGRYNPQPWKPGGNASQRFWKANYSQKHHQCDRMETRGRQQISRSPCMKQNQTRSNISWGECREW